MRGIKGPVRAALLLTALGAGVLAVGFIAFARNAADATPPADPRAEGIVVLTGGSARIDAALRLLVEGRASRLLISGVNPVVTREMLAKTFRGRYGVALACCVDLGHVARDTVGNAFETRKWARKYGFRSLLVVTNDYHMRRSMAELADALPDVELLAVPISSPEHRLSDWWKSPAAFLLLTREYGKYLLTVARLSLTPPAPALSATDPSGQ